MQLEALYEDNSYNQFLVRLAGKNLLEFDDYRQEVFMWLAENGGDVHKAADRVAKRMKRQAMKDYHLSMPEVSVIPYYDKPLEGS